MADRYAGRAIAMVDAGAQREASAYVWNVWAVIHAHRGDWARAEKANATALERLGEVGDFNLEAEVWQMRSAIYLGSGAFGSAESAWSRHRSLAERKRNPQNLCWSLLDEAETRVGRDETEAAARALDAALAIPTAPNDGSSTIEKHYATAVVRAAQRRWPEAIESADAIIEHARAPAAVGLSLRRLLRRSGGGVLRCAGGRLPTVPRPCAGRSAAARSCAAPRASSAACAPRRWLLEGLLKWAEGDHAAARERWRRAEEVALRKGTPLRARPRALRDRPPQRRRRRRAPGLPGRCGGDVRAPRRAADAAARARGAGTGPDRGGRTDDRDLPARAARPEPRAATEGPESDAGAPGPDQRR